MAEETKRAFVEIDTWRLTGEAFEFLTELPEYPNLTKDLQEAIRAIAEKTGRLHLLGIRDTHVKS